MILGRALVFLALILVVNLCAQTDWSCNHYESFPVDTCQYFAFFALKYECNGTDSMIQNVYFNDSDCSGTPFVSQPVNASDEYQCDQMKSCDSVGISFYNDSDCTDYIFGIATVIGECITSDNGTSYKADCSDTEIVGEYYFFSENCTGPSFTSEIDTSDFGSGACVELSCNSSYTPAPTSSPIEDGNIGPFDCNVGIYNIWPLVAGECSYDTSEGGATNSFMIECADDGDSATLYEYSSIDCTGDTVNETDVEYFYCGSSSNCTMTTISGDAYNSSGNCSGDATGIVEFNVAQIDDCISIFSGLGSYLYMIDNDSMHVSTYFGSDSCEDYLQFNITLTEGCNEVDYLESADATFSTSTITQTTGGTTMMSTTADTSGSSEETTMSGSTTESSDDGDDDEDTSPASKIGISNTLKQIFSFIIAIVLYKL